MSCRLLALAVRIRPLGARLTCARTHTNVVPWIGAAARISPQRRSLTMTRVVAKPSNDVPPHAARWADLSSPQSWYLRARSMPRRFVLHVGPTNSGKTHAALQRLRAASRGAYAGPLRLLAWEVYERLNDAGTKCNLLTGQERELRDGAAHVSCTVEMTDLERRVDVLVLDEIQMIGDENRGWAWTRVLLGARASEIHCCGDVSAVDLVKRVAALTGDTVEVHEYSRLSGLSVESRAVSGLSELRPGDCLVAFSRRELFDHKRRIEAMGLRCGVIYGSLPPAVRREQARRFNARHASAHTHAHTHTHTHTQTDEVGTDVLVATDAIGMGLNLQIGRVIFTKTAKFDGTSRRPLTISEIKQIGGRAGRHGSAFPHGYVGFLQGAHGHMIEVALQSATPKVTKAGLLPNLQMLQLFAAALEQPLTSAGTARSPFPDDDAVERWMSLQTSHGSAVSVLSDPAAPPAIVPNDDSDSEMDIDEELRTQAVDQLADAASERIPFSNILIKFLDHVRINSDVYFLCDFSETVDVARKLDAIRMPFKARYTFCLSPVDVDDPLAVTALRRYASRYALKGRVKLGLRPPAEEPASSDALADMESMHAVFELYMWLAHRFPAEFIQLEEARAAAQITQQLIQSGLERMSAEAVALARRRLRASGRTRTHMEELDEDGPEDVHAATHTHARTHTPRRERERSARSTRRGLLEAGIPDLPAPPPRRHEAGMRGLPRHAGADTVRVRQYMRMHMVGSSR